MCVQAERIEEERRLKEQEAAKIARKQMKIQEEAQKTAEDAEKVPCVCVCVCVCAFLWVSLSTHVKAEARTLARCFASCVMWPHKPVPVQTCKHAFIIAVPD